MKSAGTRVRGVPRSNHSRTGVAMPGAPNSDARTFAFVMVP